jgi:asparagine synthase (glutamine-hydrolysing)
MYFDGDEKVTDEARIPDDDRNVAIGNRRLSILDLSAAGNQPMGNEEDGLWIVYNGEVYNYRELREDLRKVGYAFESDTDTEVILRAYEEYGENCVERFRGMFAFAIYDAEAETLFAARDRFGIKPFYYQATDSRLTFASELTSLLDAQVVDRQLDPVGVDGFLTFGYVPGPGTIVDGVKSLPPGTTLQYDAKDGGCEIDRYWQPSFSGECDPSTDRIHELLEESVKLRLRSDVPVGAFLSGGLDSSTIVALMRAIGGSDREDLHTFSIGFDRERFSETDFAETVAEEFDTVHHSETIAADDIREHLDDIIEAMDQPTVDGVNTYFVSKLAAEAGMKVVLSGLGSDELFYGYPSFDQIASWYPKARRLYTVPSALRRPLAAAIDRTGRLVGDSTAGKVADAVRSDAPFGASYLTARGLFTRKQRRELLGVAQTDWSARIESDLSTIISETDVREAVSGAELTWYMHYQLLRDTDLMAMSHSLEVRVPFLDRALTEYVATINPDAKAVGEKGLLKDVMRYEIPLEVIEREKTGFNFPFADWLREDLDDLVVDALSESKLDGIPVDAQSAGSVRRAYRCGNEHWSRVWALVVLSRWIETHLER